MELIRLIAAGDRQAFQLLYDQFSDRVYNTALSYAQDIQLAEEITQDVFTRIYRSAGKFQGRSGLSTWIYRITVNAALDQVKRRRKYRLFQFGGPERELPDFEHPGVLLENREHSKLLFRAIDSLPANQKTAFILSFVEELPRQEVADIMELSLKAVESLLQRAKKNLREKLEKWYPGRRN